MCVTPAGGWKSHLGSNFSRVYGADAALGKDGEFRAPAAAHGGAAMVRRNDALIPMNPSVGDYPLIAIVGPTAAGKSALALELAERLDGEVVNYDSVQLYRGFDIGSGKVPSAEQRGVA